MEGMSRESYIRSKERWVEKKKARGAMKLEKPTGGRLPPGQRLTEGFPVLDLGTRPEIEPSDWTLTVDGAVQRPQVFTWDTFNALPRAEDISDMHCVTTWSKYDCRWEGVPFVDLYEAVEPEAEAAFVFFTGYDDYTVNVTLEALLDDDVLIATHFDGEPLTRDHGAPARIIIPKLYAWKGAKFVKQITFMNEDKLGFWEERGYSNTADPWTEDRFA